MTYVLASICRTISLENLLFKLEPTHPQAGSEMPNYACRKFSLRTKIFSPWVLPNITWDFFLELTNFFFFLPITVYIIFVLLDFKLLENRTHLSFILCPVSEPNSVYVADSQWTFTDWEKGFKSGKDSSVKNHLLHHYLVEVTKWEVKTFSITEKRTSKKYLQIFTYLRACIINTAKLLKNKTKQK